METLDNSQIHLKNFNFLPSIEIKMHGSNESTIQEFIDLKLINKEEERNDLLLFNFDELSKYLSF